MDWLSQRNIPYREKNVSQDGVALEELVALGYNSTPVVVIRTSAPVARGIVDGEQIIVGYSPSKLAEAFKT